jgi:hypothetical protein
VNTDFNKINEAYDNIVTEASDESIIIDKMGYSEDSYKILKDKFGMNKGKRLLWYANQLLADLKQIGVEPTEHERISDYINSSRFKSKFTNIEDWIKAMNKDNKPPKLKNFTLAQANDQASKWHKSLATDTSTDDVEDDLENSDREILHKYKDGMYWVNLNTNDCSIEGGRMGHCGTTNKDTLLSLRDKSNNSKVTVSIAKTYKTIGQIKGKANSRPHSKYDEYIVDLIIRLGVEEYDPEFYPSADFQPYAVKSEELRSQLKKQAPSYVKSVEELIESDDDVLWDFIRRDKGYANATEDELRRIRNMSEDYFTMDMAIFNDTPLPSGLKPDIDLDDEYFLSLRKTDKLSPQVQKYILDNPEFAAQYAVHVIKKPTQHFEKYIAKSPESSLFYAENLFGKETREGAVVMVDAKDVPEVIVDSIASDDSASVRFSQGFNNLPERIFKQAMKNSGFIFNYIKDNGISELDRHMIKNMAGDPENALKIAFMFKDTSTVPRELIDIICVTPNHTASVISHIYKYENVPLVIYNKLYKVASECLKVASELYERKKEIPSILFAGMAQSLNSSKFYIQTVIEYKDIPEVLAQSVSTSPKVCKELVQDFIDNFDEDASKLPENMIKSAVSRDPRMAVNIAYSVFDGENVPGYLLAAFDDNIEAVEAYAKFKQGTGLTHSMIDTLEAHPNRIINVARDIDFVTDLDKRLLMAMISDPSSSIRLKELLKDEDIDIDDLFDTEDGEDDEKEIDMLDMLRSAGDE